MKIPILPICAVADIIKRNLQAKVSGVVRRTGIGVGMEGLWKKADGFCLMAVRVLAVVLTGYLFFQGMFTICLLDSAPEHTYFIRNNWLTALAAIIFVTSLGCVLTRYKGKRKAAGREIRTKRFRTALCILAILVLALCTVWIRVAPEGLYSDQHELVTAAGQLVRGDVRAWQPGGYAYEWPFQNGMILLLAFLQSVLPLWDCDGVFQVLNAFAAVGSAVLFGRLVENRGTDRAATLLQRAVLLLYFPFFLYSTFVYGTLLGFFLVLGAVLCLEAFERTGRWRSVVGACGLTALAMQIKPNYLLMLIGIVLVLLYESIFYKKPQNVAAAVALTVSFLLGSMAVKGAIAGMTGIPVTAGNPAAAHIAMGLQEGPKAEGWFNWYNRELFMENGFDTEATEAAAVEEIGKRIAYFAGNPGEAVRFFVRKTASEWNNPTFQCFYIHNIKGDRSAPGLIKSIVNDGGKANILLIYFLDIFQSIILFGVMSYLALRRPQSMREYLFLIFFIGAFLFYAVWEAKAQYTMVYFYGLLPYGAAGYVILCRKLSCLTRTGCCRKKEDGGRQRLSLNIGVIWSAAALILILLIAFSCGGPACTFFKLDGDTEAYYSYIHECNDGFRNLRY